MNITRLKSFVMLLAGMALALVACGTSETNNEDINTNEGRHSGKLGRAEALVDSVRNETNWARTQERYDDAKYAIEKLKSPTQRKNLTSLLNRNYCHSMDTIMQIIMATSDCGNHHGKKKNGLLYVVHVERAKFSDIHSTLHSNVETAYNNHERLVKLIQGWGGRQKVNSFTDTYDNSYDNSVMATAKKELSNAPKCSYIQNNLKNPYLHERHKNFCEDVVTNLEQNSTDPNDANIVVNRIKFYKDKYKEDSDYKGWRTRLEKFQNEHKNE